MSTAPTVTIEQVGEHRRYIQGRIEAARRACALAAADAEYPQEGRAVIVHATALSNLLLDDWQLALIEDLVEHAAGEHHHAGCPQACTIDDDELVEMAARWAMPWPTLAAWLRDLAAVR
jgi:hypothetical protein